MDAHPPEDTPAARCQYYRRECGLPAGIDPEVGRIAVRTGEFWALTMPDALGQAVKTDQENRQVELGPIISHPRSQRWTFLIRPDLSHEMRLFAELFRLHVSVVRDGAEVALPSPADEQSSYRWWVEWPSGTYRPSGLALLDSIRRVTQRGRSREYVAP